ncbi:MAG: zinc-ribbon domain-containing protein [Myxococcales bacterium]|nr:zinc-ribbon domain-containing protein [Myxococcales bacterium]
MKVVCDNCRAVYKVPDAKLVKAVNKATCRNCGHRMLIPRPKPGADPDQRTLVTAVPPTPVGAPARSSGREVDSQVLPGRRAPQRSTAKSLPPSALAWENAPETALQANPNPSSSTRNSLPSGSSPLSRSAGPRSTPGPLHRATNPGSPSSPRATPPPSPNRTGTRSVPVIPVVHDPAADMNWAILGTFTALVGSFCLALLSVFTDPVVSSVLMWLGLALSFGGGVLTILVLMTGNRGRRPARSGLSLVLGGLVAVVVASVMVGTKWGAEQVDLDSFAFAQPEDPDLQPIPNPGTDEPEGEGTEEPEGTEKDGPGGLEPNTDDIKQPKERSVPPAAPTKRPAPVGAVASAPRPTPKPPPAPAAPAPRPTPAPATTAAATSAAPEPAASGVPIEAVNVMLSNNMSVKRCFVPLYRAGALPPRVNVKFNILPEGTASGISVLTPEEHANGSELETCLRVAIASIKFPPTNGNGTSITYPFILQ